MGRKKIRIAPIKDDRNRSVTFLKRKNGLFKKAYELGVLCNAEVAIVIFGTNGKLYEFANRDVAKTIEKHAGQEPHERKRPDDFVKKALAERNKARQSGAAGEGEEDEEVEDDEEGDDEDEEGENSVEDLDESNGVEKRPKTLESGGVQSSSRKSSISNQGSQPQASGSKRASTPDGPARNRTPSTKHLLAPPASASHDGKKRRLSLERARSPKPRPGGPSQQPAAPAPPPGHRPDQVASYGRPHLPYGHVFAPYEPPYMAMMGGQGFMPSQMPLAPHGGYDNAGHAMPIEHAYPVNGGVPYGYGMMPHLYPMHQQSGEAQGGSAPLLPPQHTAQYPAQEYYPNAPLPSIMHTQPTPVNPRMPGTSPRQSPSTVSHHPGAVIMHSTQSPVNAMSSSLFAHIPQSGAREYNTAEYQAQGGGASSGHHYPPGSNASQDRANAPADEDSPMTHFSKTLQRMTADMTQPVASPSSPATAHFRSDSFSASAGSVTSPYSPRGDVKMSPSSSLGVTGIQGKKPKLSLHIPEPKPEHSEHERIPDRPAMAGQGVSEGQAAHGQDGQVQGQRARTTTPPFALRNRHGGHQVESPTSSMRSSLDPERVRGAPRNAVGGAGGGGGGGGGGERPGGLPATAHGRSRTNSEPKVSSPLRAGLGSLPHHLGGSTTTQRLTQSPLSPASGASPSHHLKSSELFASPTTVFPEFAAVQYRHFDGASAVGGGTTGQGSNHYGNTADSAVGHGPSSMMGQAATSLLNGRHDDAFLYSEAMPSPLNFGKTPVMGGLTSARTPAALKLVNGTEGAMGTGTGTGVGPGMGVAGNTRSSVYHWPPSGADGRAESTMPPPPQRKMTGPGPLSGPATDESLPSPSRELRSPRRGGTSGLSRP